MTETPMDTITVDAPAGTIVGRRDGDVIRATGIRYARSARFEVPVAQPPASEIIDATVWSPAAPQNVSDDLLRGRFGEAAFGDLREDEDCQRLSVTLPADHRPDEILPVMVWIHGGSYVLGAADAPCHDPARLVVEQRVIVVGITYRLGLLGFVGDGIGRPANLGLLDMIEALRWVARNISAFGGDPDGVTVFGESAGADAAAHLMIADGTSGLFRRVILQSAPLGLASGRAAMYDAMVAATRDIDADTPIDDVLRAQRRLARGGGLILRHGLRATMAFGTQYGHAPLPREEDIEAAWAHAAARIDVLIGWNEREAAFFTSAVPGLAALPRVPVVGNRLYEFISGHFTNAVYANAGAHFLRRHRRAGGHAAGYLLEWGVPGHPLRASHTVDIPLLFGDRQTWGEAAILVGHSWSAVDKAGRRLRQIWADVARNGLSAPEDVRGLIRFDSGR